MSFDDEYEALADDGARSLLSELGLEGIESPDVARYGVDKDLVRRAVTLAGATRQETSITGNARALRKTEHERNVGDAVSIKLTRSGCSSCSAASPCSWWPWSSGSWRR